MDLKSQFPIIFREEEKIGHGLLADESFNSVAHLQGK